MTIIITVKTSFYGFNSNENDIWEENVMIKINNANGPKKAISSLNKI